MVTRPVPGISTRHITITETMAADSWNPLDWVGQAFSDWFGGMGGNIASGIEGGFIAVLKDAWLVVGPWLEILAGGLIAAFTLMVYFKNTTATFAGAAIGAAVA